MRFLTIYFLILLFEFFNKNVCFRESRFHGAEMPHSGGFFDFNKRKVVKEKEYPVASHSLSEKTAKGQILLQQQNGVNGQEVRFLGFFY